MSKVTSSDIKKKQIVEALEKSLGVVTTACKNVGIARKTYYEWYNKDDDFKNQEDSIGEIALDFVESKLYEQIRDNNIAAIIFYLKTKGKSRGYTETQNVNIRKISDLHIEYED
jgi:hypothetical protein